MRTRHYALRAALLAALMILSLCWNTVALAEFDTVITEVNITVPAPIAGKTAASAVPVAEAKPAAAWAFCRIPIPS